MHRRCLIGALCVVASWGCSGAGARSPAGDSYDTSLPAFQDPASTNDAPEISRSQGTPGGVVVLWPRVVLPRKGEMPDEASTRQLAGRLQAKLASMLRDKFPGVPVDVRPEPERVCPRAGCVAASVGILFTRSGKGGCTATVLASRQGDSPARLVPWAGGVKLKDETVPFREAPELRVRVMDHAACESLIEEAGKRDPEVEEAIRGVLR
ncbi:MAG: hypothetical protein HY898_16250 [Deltaproteobacteria bacterium]|nr:hypothetical protein [Deltaproteobacteria bacterium]